jgi:hypothetical protein
LPVRGSASAWFASQGSSGFFSILDSQEKQLLLLLLMVLVKLVYCCQVVRRNGRRRNFKMKFLADSKIYLVRNMMTSWLTNTTTLKDEYCPVKEDDPFYSVQFPENEALQKATR